METVLQTDQKMEHNLCSIFWSVCRTVSIVRSREPRSSSVDIAVDKKPCQPKQIASRSRSHSSVETSNPSSSTISQSGIVPRLVESGTVESSSLPVVPEHCTACTACTVCAACNTSTDEDTTYDSIETIEAKVETNVDTNTAEVPPEQPVARTSVDATTEACKEHTDETLDTAGHFRALTYADRINRMPLIHMVGRYNQSTVKGKYSGSQCTSTAVTAVTFHQRFVAMTRWTLKDLDYVVMTGDYHHTVFRAGTEFKHPLQTVYTQINSLRSPLIRGEGYRITAYVGELCLMFLSHTYVTREFGYPTLKEHLENETATLTGASFVITLNEFSHGIVKDPIGHWFLYDSHGTLHIPPPVYDIANCGMRYTIGATLSRFQTLDTLIAVLQDNYDVGSQCEARMITLIPEEELLENDKMDHPSRASLGQHSQHATPRGCSSSAPPITDATVEDVPNDELIALE